MTIASEITRINNNIASAYTAAEGKGATLPVSQNSANLATCISSISGGGSTNIESLSITPTTSAQTITASGGVDGYSPISVSAVTSSIDSNITAGNIKKDVTILGVTGSYEGSGGGSSTSILREVSSQGVYQMPTTNFTFSLPSNTTDLDDHVLQNAFNGCASLTNVDLSSLTTVSGNNGLDHAFSGCTGLTGVDLSSLTTLTGEYALYDAFHNTGLTNISFPALTTVTRTTMYHAFNTCTRLVSANFPVLTTVTGDYAMEQIFGGCSSLTTISFPELITVTSGSNRGPLFSAFNSCTSLRELSFPSLTTADQGSFRYMLSGCSNVTVHFPFDLESTMSSWGDVLDGFGGYNTTVLFDLGGCITTFSLTPSTGNTIVVNGDELTGTTVGLAKNSTANYEIYNSSYGLYVSTYSVPNTDSATVTVDITSPTYNTISLDTSVSGLTVKATVNGIDYILPETGNTGVYTLNIYNNTGSSVSVSYLVSGGSSYSDVSGTLTFNNSDISETVTMHQATDISFVRPDLSANGTMGGDSFAVDLPDTAATTAYKAVDSSSTTYANIAKVDDYSTFDFYNPNGLKISQLDFVFSTSTSTTNSPEAMIVEGSNDGSSWTQITTWSDTAPTSLTLTVNSSNYYKYHRLLMTPKGAGTRVRIYDLAITAVYKG